MASAEASAAAATASLAATLGLATAGEAAAAKEALTAVAKATLFVSSVRLVLATPTASAKGTIPSALMKEEATFLVASAAAIRISRIRCFRATREMKHALKACKIRFCFRPVSNPCPKTSCIRNTSGNTRSAARTAMTCDQPCGLSFSHASSTSGLSISGRFTSSAKPAPAVPRRSAFLNASLAGASKNNNLFSGA